MREIDSASLKITVQGDRYPENLEKMTGPEQHARNEGRSNPVSELGGPALSAWQNFYVIVGSSSAALIGIQFVVIALIANMRQSPTAESISAFGTPTW